MLIRISCLLMLFVLLHSAPPLSAAALVPTEPSSAEPKPAARAMVPLEKIDFRYADQTLSEDVTWHGTVLVEGWLTVAPQATLSIQPGTVVRFRKLGGQSSGLLITGRLNAVGSAQQPILFTSVYGDATPGDWQGIMLLATEKKNLLRDLRIEAADNGLLGSFASFTMTN